MKETTMFACTRRSGFRAHRRACVTGLVALAMAAAAPMASAQAQAPFPAKVIRIVPFGTAGGPIDVIARAYAEKLQQRWGQSVIVEPRPGASGILAADAVAKAPPDGHTVLFTLPLTTRSCSPGCPTTRSRTSSRSRSWRPAGRCWWRAPTRRTRT
jgi:hypothetical protein